MTTHHHTMDKRLEKFVAHPKHKEFVDQVIALFPDKSFNECFALAGHVFHRRANAGKYQYCDYDKLHAMPTKWRMWYEIPIDKESLLKVKPSTINNVQKILYTILSKGN